MTSQNWAYSDISFDNENELVYIDIDKINQENIHDIFKEALAQILRETTYSYIKMNEHWFLYPEGSSGRM